MGWMYAVIAAHLLAGMLLPLAANAALFSHYHDGILHFFFGVAEPAGARSIQIWWTSLFGPTLQAASVWMLGLAIMGDKQRNAFAWAMLILGLVIWAPQDMFVSAGAQCWINVWLDLLALGVMLPPLICLCRIDLKGVRT